MACSIACCLSCGDVFVSRLNLVFVFLSSHKRGATSGQQRHLIYISVRVCRTEGNRLYNMYILNKDICCESSGCDVEVNLWKKKDKFMKLPRCRVDGTLNMIVRLKLVGCWTVGACCPLCVTHIRTSIAVRMRREVISMHTKVKPFPLALGGSNGLWPKFKVLTKFGTMTMAVATKWFWIKAKHICEGFQ